MAPNLAKLCTLAIAITLLPPHVFAVCSSGQIAVGLETQGFTGPGPGGQQPLFSGFEMANDCSIISQNGQTDDDTQYCAGDYFGGASVTCDDSNTITSAVDTSGISYTCSDTTDSSCNITDGQTSFRVIACCSPN